MKKLAILGTIFLGFTSFGQDLAVENTDNNKILYRGFENKIVLDQFGDDNHSFQIEAINCEVIKPDENRSEDVYIVKTKNKARTATINIVSNGQTIERMAFNVENLPSPSLFWGNSEAGSTISNSAEIVIKYSTGVTLEPNFEIVGWTCSLDDLEFNGQGNLLSQEMLDYTKSMVTGELITIEVKVNATEPYFFY